jgi:DnaJ family protein A protein 2
MSDFYSRLGVSKDASPDEIRRAYRDLARQHHPDKGGDAEKFKSIQEAAEVLTDEARRQEYDARGRAGQMPFTGGGMPFADMFNMFGGGGPMFGNMTSRGGKGPSQQVDMNITLENFFAGIEMNINFKQTRKCPDCSGSADTCNGCGGAGMRRVVRQMGPMMINMDAPCDACQGRGRRTTKQCDPCGNRRFVEKEKTLNAKVLPGMTDGERLVFEGECSDSNEYSSPGDIVVVLHVVPSKYTWKDADLHYKHTITYAESVLGFEFTLDDHPSGKKPSYVWTGGPLIHGASLIFFGAGMPKKGLGFGDLKVEIVVTPPVVTRWSDADREKLEAVLGKVVLSKTDAQDLLHYSE